MDYSKMTNAEFVEILEGIVKEEGANILSIPGVYEILSEFYNNEVLKIWEVGNEKSSWRHS